MNEINSLGNLRCRWENDDNDMGHKGLDSQCVDWMKVSQDRDSCQAIVNTIMKFRTL